MRAGNAVVCREASGSGHGIGATPGTAHESAIKEAETDAMKRALITFGNPFGLALYDPELRGVRGGARRIPDRHAISWVVLTPDGRVLATYSDPVDFCAALQRQIEKVEDPRALKALWARHAAALEMLRWNVPDLTNEEGIHRAEVLLACYSRRREVVHELAGTSKHQLRRARPQPIPAAIQSQQDPSRGAFAIRSTCGSLPPFHAWSAAVRPANPIICASPNLPPWSPNPAISGSCRSAKPTTEPSMMPATSGSGGKSPKSIPWLKPSGCGSSTKDVEQRADISSDSCMPSCACAGDTAM